MRILAFITTIALILIVAGSCTSDQERLHPWIGQHYSNLLGSWGAPKQIIDDGIGGKIIIYNRESTFTTSSKIVQQKPGVIRIDPSEKIGHIKEYIYRTDKSGIIISVNVNTQYL